MVYRNSFTYFTLSHSEHKTRIRYLYQHTPCSGNVRQFVSYYRTKVRYSQCEDTCTATSAASGEECDRGVHSVGSGYGPVAGSCEDGDEPSGLDATD
jgi:hypothetical protein